MSETKMREQFPEAHRALVNHITAPSWARNPQAGPQAEDLLVILVPLIREQIARDIEVIPIHAGPRAGVTARADAARVARSES